MRLVNQAEASYWAQAQGERVGDSTDILGFDCGGEQWVLEVCFPMGSLSNETYADITFVRELLELVETHGIPAPGPIEQRLVWYRGALITGTTRRFLWMFDTYAPCVCLCVCRLCVFSCACCVVFWRYDPRWTARSTSPMSPAYSVDPQEKFCWVGIIMYTPSGQSQEQRENIRRAFVNYGKALEPLLLKYKAQVHWAKLEPPLASDYMHSASSGSHDDGTVGQEKDVTHDVRAVRERIRRKYPVDDFKRVRKVLDPHGILSNSLVEKFLD